jgi:uncharacterized protein YjbI with pentapeptide repeats
MKPKTLALTTLLISLSFAAPAVAEKLEHTRKLLSTKQCPQCELSNAGLVFADLTGANLAQANLAGANLSRANLQGADLRGANLMGANLVGANLVGAKLDGANLSLADLRTAYLSGATLEGTVLQNAQLQGATGLSTVAGKPEEFYLWAMQDGQNQNYAAAIENFSQALQRKPDFAEAYLGRGVARFQIGDHNGAIADSRVAEELFTRQGNKEGSQISKQFVQELTGPPKKPRGNFFQGLMNVVGGLLQLYFLR